MKEIEIKIIEVDKEQLEKKLLKNNAIKVGEYNIESITFDNKNGELFANRQLLRLRKKGKNYLTFKEKATKGLVKICEETEFEVGDFEKTKLLLEKLGFIATEVKPKKRTTWKLKNSLIEFDEYAELPTFAEIESSSQEEIEELIKLLEIDENKIRNWDGFELFQHYKKENLVK